MRITVLVDNNTLIDRYFYGEPGVSYFIEEGDVKLLFDVGYSDVFFKNANRMKISLDDIHAVVISHGHNDHTGGLFYLVKHYIETWAESSKHDKPKLIAHPETFSDKYIDKECIGSLLKEEQLKKHFQLVLSQSEVWLTEKLVFLGQIERKNDFENKVPIGKWHDHDFVKDDFLMDDSALAYKSSEGLVIITGCSHSGICNIVEQAKRVCNDERIAAIIGGFHLLNPDEELLKKTCEYLTGNQIKELYPCHCTDLKSKIELSRSFTIKEVGVGLVVEFK
ncbi:MBL fold metallo-hydrolase [Sporomusa acidovorans]|uniref:Metallo-beta-lactamase domain-containing protein n=1 Tax=Sporomusa acidovorans (strain ATCC 49682 / DSM 3132 / Mol) TaxID=1123286 RepID=A0ABZ3IXK6_SPOA4|nr:MBL fold metallo-hydrolase [Sporomusa acidovorans]OZC23288.1 metallo-beta-lactamase superfamily protein [Sporomusa acidovorans DSM 3132]SDE40659.1 7,8-dihydropterin-6-yl-methyl-4-(beta-D-ribofuranosyl)aminobenzene 5'-phosphate synthase [Sporomusa acidovorans]